MKRPRLAVFGKGIVRYSEAIVGRWKCMGLSAAQKRTNRNCPTAFTNGKKDHEMKEFAGTVPVFLKHQICSITKIQPSTF